LAGIQGSLRAGALTFFCYFPPAALALAFGGQVFGQSKKVKEKKLSKIPITFIFSKNFYLAA